jgi:hypothetical protein
MASLLDMMMQQVNPNIGGLLAARREQDGGQPAPAPSAPAPGPAQGAPDIAQALQGGIQPIPEGPDPAQVEEAHQQEQAQRRERNPLHFRLFAGDPVPGLSPEQNKELRQQALLTAGLAVLAQPNATLGQALAMGALSARQQTAASAGALLDEQRMQARLQQRTAVFADANLTELQKYEEMLRIATIEGDEKMAARLLDVVKDIREAGAQAEWQVVEDGDRKFWRDPATNQLHDFYTREPVTGDPGPRQSITGTIGSIYGLAQDVQQGRLSPEDASAILALSQQQASAGAHRSTVNVNAGSLRPGERYVYDAQGNVSSIEEIPGGQVQTERIAQANRDRGEAQTFVRLGGTVVADANLLLDRLDQYGSLVAGPGALLAKLPGTAARDVAGMIRSIQSNVGLNTLLDLKKQSGAGLGHVSDKQFALLAASLGELDQAQTVGQVRRIASRIGDIYDEIVSGLEESFEGVQRYTPPGERGARGGAQGGGVNLEHLLFGPRR